MAEHSLNKKFDDRLRVLEVTDPGHANTFNPLFSRLINNDAFLKSAIEAVKEDLIEYTQKDRLRGITHSKTFGIKLNKSFGVSYPRVCGKTLKFTRVEG